MLEVKGKKDIKIKPKDKWIYCKKDGYICYENVLYSDDIWVKFDEPILSISVDEFILLRLKSKIVLLDKSGNILWTKKMKANAICQKGKAVAVAKNKKLIVFDKDGRKVLSKKFKAKINSIDIHDGLIVGTEKGVHFLKDKELIWELLVGKITFLSAGDIIIAAIDNEILAITLDGVLLWRQRLDNIVYDAEINEEIRVHALGYLVRLSFDGKIISIEKEEIERFLPLPWITVKKELDRISRMLKDARKLRPKKIKKDVKIAKKLFKRYMFGEAHEIINRAIEELRFLQLQVILPKKVKSGRTFHITLRFYNFFEEPIENITVDLTDLENYFEISEKIFELPQIRKGMFIEKDVSANPKYEGLFLVTVEVKCNFGEIEKKFNIKVTKSRFPLISLRRKEKREESILDLLK